MNVHDRALRTLDGYSAFRTVLAALAGLPGASPRLDREAGFIFVDAPDGYVWSASSTGSLYIDLDAEDVEAEVRTAVEDIAGGLEIDDA